MVTWFLAGMSWTGMWSLFEKQPNSLKTRTMVVIGDLLTRSLKLKQMIYH